MDSSPRPMETRPAARGSVKESSARNFLTRKLSTEEKERVADIVIYLGVIAPAIFLALYGNLQVYHVIGGNTGVPRATLNTSLIEADSVLGAFLAAMFVIRYELTKLWREEDEKKAKKEEEERKKNEDAATKEQREKNGASDGSVT
jgi:TRAP-type C4-dicarboxylate transport system permease small subunit